MNRWKAIVSTQTVNLLSSSTSGQLQSSSSLIKRGQSQGGGQKEDNDKKANLWLSLGTATAASALAFKLFQEKDRCDAVYSVLII